MIKSKEAKPSNSLTLIESPIEDSTNTWEIYVDGSSNSKRLGAKIVITSLEGIISEHALHLEFPVTNNEADYEAIIARL